MPSANCTSKEKSGRSGATRRNLFADLQIARRLFALASRPCVTRRPNGRCSSSGLVWHRVDSHPIANNTTRAAAASACRRSRSREASLDRECVPSSSGIRRSNRRLSLAFIAPSLVKAAVEGRLPRAIGRSLARRAGRMVAAVRAAWSGTQLILSEQHHASYSRVRNGIFCRGDRRLNTA
jgi:hypothetical protein